MWLKEGAPKDPQPLFHTPRAPPLEVLVRGQMSTHDSIDVFLEARSWKDLPATRASVAS